MAKGGISDLEEFTGNVIGADHIDLDLPLESQGIVDSLTALQFIIFLEKKYTQRLSKEQISSIKVYRDLINLFQ